MKVIKLMLCEFINQIKTNLITAFLMSVVAIILAVFVSVYSFQYSKFKPFKNLNFKKGFYVTHGLDRMTDLEALDGVDKVYGLYEEQAMTSEQDMNYEIVGYEKWAWENNKAQLVQGKWYTQTTINNYIKQGKIPVVLGGDTRTYKVGDCIDLYLCNNYFDEESEKILLSFCITGILSKDAGVLGNNSNYNISNITYEAFYDVADSMSTAIDGKLGPVLFVPVEVLKEKGLNVKLSSRYFIKYKDSLTDEEVERLNGELYGKTDGTGITMSDFLNWSEDKLKNTLITYVPFLVIGLMIIMLSVYSLANISVSKLSKHMGIFTLVGASRLHNYLLLLSNAIGTVFLSIGVSVLGLVFYGNYASTHEIYFELNGTCIVAIVVSYIFFFAFMSLSMYLVFRKKTTRGMLISLHK